MESKPDFVKIADGLDGAEVPAIAAALRAIYVQGLHDAAKAVAQFKICEFTRMEIPKFAASVVESWAVDIEDEGKRLAK